MEPKILFEKIESLLEVLEQYKKDQTLNFQTTERLHSLNEVFRVIYNRPNLQLDLTCPSCVRDYLNQLIPYYEREYPKYLKSIEPVAIKSEETKVEEVTEPIVGKKKRVKRNGKKA